MEFGFNFIGDSMEFHMESTWTGPWNVHGMVYSMVIPYGFHSGYRIGKWVRAQPKIFHMESMEWGVESTHSIWIPYGRYQGV
jgi:phenolic acid decarboxylase